MKMYALYCTERVIKSGVMVSSKGEKNHRWQFEAKDEDSARKIAADKMSRPSAEDPPGGWIHYTGQYSSIRLVEVTESELPKLKRRYSRSS